MNWSLYLSSPQWRQAGNGSSLRALSLGCLESTSGQTLETELRSPDWPNARLTGSFAAIIENADGSLTLVNDVLGIYPLYYGETGGGFVVCDSVTAAIEAGAHRTDPIGLFEAIHLPEGVLLGRRTLLEGIKRLLPGERLTIRFGHGSPAVSSQFDNRLFGHVRTVPHEAVWEAIRSESEVLLRSSGTVSVALSGGLDSRLVLGAIPSSKRVTCLTYGADDFYEVGLARRLAKIAGAEFTNRWSYDDLWPDIATIREHIDGHSLAMWYAVVPLLRRVRGPLLYGDMCEALPGRNIKRYTTRRARIASFWRNEIHGRVYTFTPAGERAFDHWATQKWEQIRRWFPQVVDAEHVHAIRADFEELVTRVRAHDIPSTELYEELWQWYTHARLGANGSRQVLFGLKYGAAFSPFHSSSLLIACSNIDPNQRLGYRMVDALFRHVPELRRFGSVPVAQSPFLPGNAPRLLRLLAWGLRSSIDQGLTSAAMRRRAPRARRHLVRSIDWGLAYQAPTMMRQLNEYFAIDRTGLKERALRDARSRKAMLRWPYENADILRLAWLNALIQDIEQSRRAVGAL